LLFDPTLYTKVLVAQVAVQYVGAAHMTMLTHHVRGPMPEAPLIAIIDDDQSIRMATEDLFKAEGYSASAFENAETFLESPMRATVACLVADMRMRGMSGLDLSRKLAAAGQAIPTVIITAYPASLTQQRALEAGVACYLTKPFTPDELLDCVREALSR
jgi:FixJ family two-component response regulator